MKQGTRVSQPPGLMKPCDGAQHAMHQDNPLAPGAAHNIGKRRRVDRPPARGRHGRQQQKSSPELLNQEVVPNARAQGPGIAICRGPIGPGPERIGDPAMPLTR